MGVSFLVGWLLYFGLGFGFFCFYLGGFILAFSLWGVFTHRLKIKAISITICPQTGGIKSDYLMTNAVYSQCF